MSRKSWFSFIMGLLMTASQGRAQTNSPSFLPFQALITNVSDVPQASLPVSMVIQITDGTGCVLYQETQSTTTDTKGMVALAIGSGTSPSYATASPSFSGSFKGVFKNNGTSVTACLAGGPATSTLTSAMGRKIQFNVNGGGFSTGVDIGAVAYSYASEYAVTSDMLGGWPAGNFLMNNGANSMAAPLNLQSWAAAPGGTAPGQLGYNSAAGKLEYYNGSVWTQLGPTGSVTMTGDVTGTNSASVVSKIQGVAVSASVPTTGQVLTYNGANWLPQTPAASGITALTGDVTATGPGSVPATVAQVGGVTAANVATGANAANAATNANTVSTIVKRDASGNFSAGTITANLSGNATNVTGVVAVANGGTGNSLVGASGSVIYSNGVTFQPSGAGTAGQVLTSTGAGAPSWAAASDPTKLPLAGGVMTGPLGLDSVSTASESAMISGWTSAQAGNAWYNSTLNQVRYWDGSTAQSVGGAGGITSLNGLGGSAQSFNTGTSGTDFNISSAGSIHSFNIPSASSTARGLLTSADWNTFNSKVNRAGDTFTGTVNLPASTSSAGTAPAKIAQGVLMTTPEAGAIEYDGTNLYYTDNSATRQQLAKNSALGNYVLKVGDTMSGVLDMGTHKITNVVDPTNPQEAATKNYVDTSGGNTSYVLKAGDTLTGSLNLRASSTAAGTAPVKLPAGVLMTTPEAGAIEYDGTNVYYTDSTATRRTIANSGSLANYVLKAGDSMSGNLNMNAHNINGVADPVSAQDAATKNYADVNFIKANGSTPLTGNWDAGAFDIANVGNVYLAASKNLGLGQYSTDPSTAGWGVAQKGYTWFNTTSNQIKFWDGSSIQALGVSGAGLTSLNGQSGSTQTFAAGSSGTSPAISSAANVHTLNVPLASVGGVTSGTISNTDYTNFSNKVDRTGDTMTGPLNLPSNGLAVGGNQLKVAGGQVGIGTTTPTAMIEVDSIGVTAKGAVVRGFAGQTANLQEWQNSGTTILSYVDPNGYLFLPGTAGSANSAATKGYVDGAVANFVLKAGDTMTGDLVAPNFNANVAYKIGGTTVFSIPGTQNTFVGNAAGPGNTTGAANSFFGTSAGSSNTTGSSNAFFGAGAGSSNTTGNSNSFFGTSAGFAATAGSNTFIGYQSGLNVTAGSANTIVGYQGGMSLTTGGNNVMIGANATTGAAVSSGIAIGNGAVVNTSGSGQIGTGTNNTGNTLQFHSQRIADSAWISAGTNIAAIDATGNITKTGTAVVGSYVQVAGDTMIGTLNLRASTAAAGTSPLKIAQGVLMTTPETGAVEYDGTNLYYTDSTAVRQQLAKNSSLGSYVLKAGDTMTGPLVNNSNSTSTALAVTQSGTGYAATLMGGNVGIGTTAPLSHLHIEGGGAQNIILNSTSGTSAKIDLQYFGTSKGSIAVNSSDTYVDSGVGSKLHMRAEGLSDSIVAVPGGNVGMGTASPSAHLHVIDSAMGSAIRGESTAAGGYGVLALSTTGYALYANSTNNYAIYGFANASTGVYGYSSSTSGIDAAISGKGVSSANGVMGTSDGGASGLFQSNVDANPSATLITKRHTATATSDLFAAQSETGTSLARIDNLGNFSATSISSSGPLMLTNGSAGSPVLTFSGDTGTGLYHPSAGVLATSTNSIERMRIDGTGNVGIGTTSPGAGLDVQSGSGTMSIGGTSGTLAVTRAVASNAAPDIYLQKSRGTISAPAAVINGDVLGDVSFTGYDGTSYSTRPTGIFAQVNGTVAVGSIPTDLIFGAGSTANFQTNERMRVTSIGNVGIGTTSPMSRLSVSGGLAVGSYAGTAAAPANGLIVSGPVGIGTSSPPDFFDVAPASTAVAGQSVNISAQSTTSASTGGGIGLFAGGAAAGGTGGNVNIMAGSGTNPGGQINLTGGGASQGKVQIGVGGVGFTSMGTCTIATTSMLTGSNTKPCAGLPVGSAVYCSPSASQGASVTWGAWAASAGNVNINMSANGVSANWYCMWMQP